MAKDWDIIITNKSNLLSIDLSEVWRYRDLLTMYVKRDIITFYKQTILGPLWFIIQPVFTTIMFMFVFGGIAGISTDGIPQAVFYLAGLVCWNYFQDCLSKCSDTFNANQGIFGKVYFPRLVVPLSIVISNLIKMAIQFTLFLIVYIYYFASGVDFHPLHDYEISRFTISNYIWCSTLDVCYTRYLPALCHEGNLSKIYLGFGSQSFDSYS